jgi:hypothetical protein
MRFFELSSLAGIYANQRCRGDIDAGYRELIEAIDHIGFLGSRILYLDRDVQPPYFSQPIKSEKEKPKPLPHKTNPIITRQFIEIREKNLGWPVVRDAYLAKSWINSLPAAQWLQSKGITPPSSIDWSLKPRDAACAKPAPEADRRNAWKPKLGNRLTPSESAICDAFNALWPNGDADHKAGARNKSILDWLTKQDKSTVSSRTIQRALSKIAYD